MNDKPRAAVNVCFARSATSIFSNFDGRFCTRMCRADFHQSDDVRTGTIIHDTWDGVVEVNASLGELTGELEMLFSADMRDLVSREGWPHFYVRYAEKDLPRSRGGYSLQQAIVDKTVVLSVHVDPSKPRILWHQLYADLLGGLARHSGLKQMFAAPLHRAW